MSSQRLEGEYGISVIAPPDRPEDPGRWRQKQFTDAELMKRNGWTEQQLSTARSYLGYPKGRAFTNTQTARVTIKADEKDVLRWESSARACGWPE